MKTKRNETKTAGLFVEFYNADGRLLGCKAYADWHGRPVPGMGDTFSCDVPGNDATPTRRLTGLVTERHFEVQHDEHGKPCVWLRLVLKSQRPPQPAPRLRIEFSRN